MSSISAATSGSLPSTFSSSSSSLDSSLETPQKRLAREKRAAVAANAMYRDAAARIEATLDVDMQTLETATRRFEESREVYQKARGSYVRRLAELSVEKDTSEQEGQKAISPLYKKREVIQSQLHELSEKLSIQQGIVKTLEVSSSSKAEAAYLRATSALRTIVDQYRQSEKQHTILKQQIHASEARQDRARRNVENTKKIISRHLELNIRHRVHTRRLADALAKSTIARQKIRDNMSRAWRILARQETAIEQLSSTLARRA